MDPIAIDRAVRHFTKMQQQQHQQQQQHPRRHSHGGERRGQDPDDEDLPEPALFPEGHRRRLSAVPCQFQHPSLSPRIEDSFPDPAPDPQQAGRPPAHGKQECPWKFPSAYQPAAAVKPERSHSVQPSGTQTQTTPEPQTARKRVCSTPNSQAGSGVSATWSRVCASTGHTGTTGRQRR
ncbi:hypothetical protein ACOMHN_009596 [Nucella lapillus]